MKILILKISASNISMHFSLKFLSNILIITIFSFLFLSCQPKSDWHHESGMIWNTMFNITWEGASSLSDSIIPALHPVDESLSVFNDSSLVAAINNNSATPVDTHFRIIYEECLKINEESGGMYDPTVAPAVEAWGFARNHEVSQDTARLDSIREFVGISKTRISGNILIKDDRRIAFNFSSLAKGYGCDLLSAMFIRNGVDNFLIEIGGEVACHGTNRDGGKWRIAIDAPVRESLPGENTAAVVGISNCGMATSGNYRNFKNDKGEFFGHTISPVTCRPVLTDVISATVIATSCMEADALATSCMVSGSEAAKEICRKHNAPLMLILRDSTIYYSDNFRTLLKK